MAVKRLLVLRKLTRTAWHRTVHFFRVKTWTHQTMLSPLPVHREALAPKSRRRFESAITALLRPRFRSGRRM